jgi:hypothetical protein
VVEFRLYRAAFLPALAALVALLFSLQGVPEALSPSGTPINFDGATAAKAARQIAGAEPDRTPGSSGEAAVADLVEKRFAAIRAGEVSEQTYDSSFDGDDVQLRNVLLTLPGESDRIIAVIAARDSARGPGATSSAAATATLLELARDLGSSTHSKTLLFASTDGGSDGATGARQLADHLPDANLIDAAIVISQPAASTPHGAAVVATSTGVESASIQLVRTAERAVFEQAQRRAEDEGVFGELARLAIPSGLGEQAPLIEEGVDAVTLTSAGERPVPPTADQPDDVSTGTLATTGRAALQTVLALDASPAPPEHGPGSYVSLGGSLVPGWALAVMALALLLPAAVAAADGTARAARSGAAPAQALAWIGILVLGPLAAVLSLYLLALVGIVPRPRFPFDPGRFEVGFAELVAMVLLAAIALGTWYLLRAWRLPTAVTRSGALVAGGLVSVLAVLVVWLANPYLALLLVPLAHPWLVCARPRRTWDPLVMAGALAAALVPVVAAALYVAGALDLGAGACWQLVLAVGDWQVPPPVALGMCALCGSGLALLLASGRREGATRTAPVDASPMG